MLGLCMILGASAAQGAEPQPRIRGADLQLLEAVREIAGQIERVRGEPFSRPPLAVRTPDAMRQVAAEIRAFNVLPRERLEARGRAWADIGLDEGGDLPRRLFVRLAADLDGVGFDPEGNRLLVAPDRLTVADFQPDDDESGTTVLLLMGVRPDEPLIAHVLMHVRQRERAGRDVLEATTDRLLANLAWAEGEANLVAVRHLFEGMGMADEILQLPLNLEEVLDGLLLPPEISALPGAEGDLVRFVHLEGYARATEAFRSGGFAALDLAARSRRTTRDVLHPDRAPLPEAVPPSTSAPIEGRILADADTLGEQAVVVLVARGSGKDNLGLLAADGWVGDRLERWESPGDSAGKRGMTLWTTHWATETDAADFVYAYIRVLAARFPTQTIEVEDPGRRRLEASGRIWTLARKGLAVELRVEPTPPPPPRAAPAKPRESSPAGG